MTDFTYMSKQEIDAMKSIFTTCKHCHGKFTATFEGEDECDDCYNIRMSEEIGILELKVSRGYKSGTWECTRKDWDLGVP